MTANVDGLVHSHRFPGANTAVPIANQVRRSSLLFPRARPRRDRRSLFVLKKLFGETQIAPVLVRDGHCGVRAGEAMRMHEAVNVAVIVRGNLRHVAIRAIHRRLRVVEGARALPGNAACLPVVILIEAANPA